MTDPTLITMTTGSGDYIDRYGKVRTGDFIQGTCSGGWAEGMAFKVPGSWTKARAVEFMQTQAGFGVPVVWA